MNLNILLVDDSATIRAIIAKSLRLAQIPVHDVLEAPNGAAALALLEEHWIDLIITDIHMPEMDGLELIDRLHADDTYSQIPVVIVSTEGNQDVLEQARQKGVDAFIRKPFTPEEIRDVVNNALGVCHES
jgi:two-component system chemotaxis response regulator CheY